MFFIYYDLLKYRLRDPFLSQKMDMLKKIKISGIKYCLADDILKLRIPYVKSCINSRRLVAKKKILKDNYIFARENDGEWIPSRGISNKCDKVLLKMSWVKKNIFDDIDDTDDNDDIDENVNNDDENNEDRNDDNEDDNQITIAPGIITLKKIEKLKDNTGKIVEIEVRGTRDHDNCYFKVYDVAKGF